jgi:beta-mannosidase
MNKHVFIFGLVLLCLGCKPKQDIPVKISIQDHWEFKNTKDSIWLPAIVPGDVYSDLLKNKVIEEPFVKDNELKLQWISENDWEYKTIFSLDKETLQKKHIELHFEGLDTYTSIYLNDSLILKTNNTFRQWHSDIKPILKDENSLIVVFKNTTDFETQAKAQLPYELPEGNRIFTRKAQFQYGWDWGPKFNTSGIWRPITLHAWNDLKIEDVFIKQHKLEDTLATLSANFELKTSLNKSVYVDIIVNNTKIATHSITLDSSKTNYSIPFGITNPKLWWTHNLGEPYQYDLKFIIRQEKTVLDTFQLKKGIRTIELVTNKDTQGEAFYFKLNGIPVYMKGSNYIPQHSFQNQVSDNHYDKLLNDVVDANMNMLRVWGGGIYENDVFYELCNKKGVLVWQDFMFAGAMYPGDTSFLENVQQEAIDNVKRLRNHASIALWCGNNETSEGWHRWGWQTGKTKVQKEEIWINYLKIFDSILPNTVTQYTDKTSYWESSPKYGRGNPKYKTEGDAHDWWIWHDAYPFEHLENNVPRFMSEFGFQSFPSYEAIQYINQKDSIDLSSEGFQSHEKHSRGFQLIRDYMERDFPVPTNDEEYVYMSQVLQAYGITKGLEAHRRAKPYNMGTLYWQLNDCWPVVSWSSIDFFGNWKALHYKAKKAFKNVLISSVIENDSLKTYIINDDLKSYQGQLSINILDFYGNEVWSNYEDIYISKNSSALKQVLNLKSILANKNGVVVVSKFNDNVSYFYLVKPKDLKLQKDEIKRKITKTKTGFNIELSSTTLQKDVFLYTKQKGHFKDNYIDLLPNTTIIIAFKTDSLYLDDLRIKTLNEFIN